MGCHVCEEDGGSAQDAKAQHCRVELDYAVVSTYGRGEGRTDRVFEVSVLERAVSADGCPPHV